MENTLTAAELKRRGMAAIESGLRKGPVHIYKRNRRAAVVLSEADYQQLLAAKDKAIPGMTALEWLQAHPSEGSRSKRDIDQQLRDERSW